MQNIFTFVISITLLLFVSLGCGGIVDRVQEGVSGSDSNRSVSDRAVDTTVGETKIGIQSCDDVVTLLNDQINDPDENFVTKALKRTMLNRFRDGLKQSLEQNNSNKQAVEEFCTEFKKNLEIGLKESTNSSK